MLSIETLVDGVTTGRVSRRGFLQGAVALGLSASGAVALLEACTSGTQGTSAADLTFVVWSYGVETIKDNIKKLEAKVSGLHVNFQDFAWTNYHDTMVARFAAKTPTDVCYSSDHWLSEWAAAGWLSPLEQKYPDLNAYTSDYFPYVIQGMTYQGKNYGIPYYADTISYAGLASCAPLGRADNRIPLLAMRQELSAGASLISAAPSNPKILDLAARFEG